MIKKPGLFSHFKSDVSSGLVVFLVALPLCLGIALASGAPLFSGIISGVIGGIVVGYLSQSNISVSGPAAGLTAIVLTAITDLGAYDVFLFAALVAGCIQLLLGFLKAGSISNYIPSSVIEGMLAGIGIIIILKQIPHAFGYDKDYEGDEDFIQLDGSDTISSLLKIFEYVQPGVIIITLVSMLILIFWNKIPMPEKLKTIPPALIAVFISIGINQFFIYSNSSLMVLKEHLVTLPSINSVFDFKNLIVTPDFTSYNNPKIWKIAFTIAVVASIETLLCIEAADKMEQGKITNTNRELKAQGIGNILSALLGGLPMTSVVVRTSANYTSGAKTKLATITHGLFLLISVIAIPSFLNMIPLATLSAILLLVGYKLTKPSLFINFWKEGRFQFYPFIITVLGVVFIDLLSGVALGILTSIFFILEVNLKNVYRYTTEETEEGLITHIDLSQEVTFLNKAQIKKTLYSIPENSEICINAHKTVYIASDVIDLIQEFIKINAVQKNIKVTLKGFKNI